MKREAAEILKDALALPPEARAALAGSLLESLDSEVDEDAEAAWATEVNRRVADLDSGAVKTISWTEIRRRLAALMHQFTAEVHPPPRRSTRSCLGRGEWSQTGSLRFTTSHDFGTHRQRNSAQEN